MRKPEEIAAIIDQYNLADRDALRRLEARVRRDLIVREILLFADFLHAGDFRSSSGKWGRGLSGYVTQTHQEDDALTRLWTGLVRSCLLYIGAASVLEMQGARLLAGHAYADEGDGPTLYDYTLDALVRAVPKEYKKQLDEATRLDRIEGKVGETVQGVKDAAREGVEKMKKAVKTTIPKVYIKTASMSADELRDAVKPKTRSSGGGRPKERDLDDAQVKAVLADMRKTRRDSFRAHCAHIVRTMKPGQYDHPYETAKNLDSAVHRYCDANGIVLDCRTTKTGAWSTKS